VISNQGQGFLFYALFPEEGGCRRQTGDELKGSGFKGRCGAKKSKAPRISKSSPALSGTLFKEEGKP
jgi:hypothetical protein